MIKVISHINKLFTSVSYIVFDDESRDCWIIDVGDYAEIKSLISDYKLKGVFLTQWSEIAVHSIRQLIRLP